MTYGHFVRLIKREPKGTFGFTKKGKIWSKRTFERWQKSGIAPGQGWFVDAQRESNFKNRVYLQDMWDAEKKAQPFVDFYHYAYLAPLPRIKKDESLYETLVGIIKDWPTYL